VPQKIIKTKQRQEHAEPEQTANDPEPGKYKNAFILVGGRRGDADDHVQSAKHVCKKLNHWTAADFMMISTLREFDWMDRQTSNAT
jgi:hypothetical protein